MRRKQHPGHDDLQRCKNPAEEVRPDLQDPSKGKDLSYLNEMPQMSGYEGVKAGIPPAKEEDKKENNPSEKHD